MDIDFRDRFLVLWAQYFDGAKLPLCLYYSDDEEYEQYLRPTSGHVCMVGQLGIAHRGETLSYNRESVGCGGGRRYLGFTGELAPNFEFFLSCGIPGKLEGERYKKTPELVREMMERFPDFEAPARYAVFKRWDKLTGDDEPEVVIFFAPPDVLSGLFTLSGFDEAVLDTVIAPFGAGCATIAQYPYLERNSEKPRAVLGMFDVSARPVVPDGELSFAIPIAKFARMVANMEESFLVTRSWSKVRRRIASTGEGR